MHSIARPSLGFAVVLSLLAACSGGAGGETDGGSGGGSAATGGGSAATGGGSAATGGGSAAVGGGSAATGGGSAAVGGGSAATGGGSAATGGGTPTDGGPTLAESIAATTATAKDNSACQGIKPFYWEIGDENGPLASDSLTPDGGLLSDGGTGYQADSVMLIASASKWLYSSYFVQKTNGVLTAEDIQFFNFWSGYTDLTSCAGTGTVGNCLLKVNGDGTTNGTLEPANVNFFFYSGGHEQKHASLNGLSAMNNADLATEVLSQLGADVSLSYTEPQLAGGGKTSAASYAKVLRKILSGELVMKTLLGSHAVCTNPHTCALAKSSPLATGTRDLSYHYSIGHWVEDDPAVGDGAFSSPGSFGFYPWIDSTQTRYGVIAREADAGSGFDSVNCGLALRKAWRLGVEQ